MILKQNAWFCGRARLLFLNLNRSVLFAFYCAYASRARFDLLTFPAPIDTVPSYIKYNTMADQRGVVVVAERGQLQRPTARRSNRLKLKSVATSKNVPHDINSEDGLAVVSILVEARMIDIDQEERLIVFNFSRLTKYKVNDEGRIITLHLGMYKADDWILSEAILKLRSLKELRLSNCGHIPFTFNFPNLTYLLFIYSGEKVLKNSHLLNGIKPTLKVFGIAHPEFASDNISSLITSVANFPHLKALVLFQDGKSGDDMDPLLHQLKKMDLVLTGGNYIQLAFQIPI